ncbi:MAG: leucine--tRNA ligase [Deltaproteobacteria bacterium]|nr:leucine--tRNA ligase [Deltaproteobacteria bacterium]
MGERYDAGAVEPKWQERWEKSDLYRARDDDRDRPTYYILDMFPYPSGEGLHVGHPEGYTATDILARFRRMRGDNVLHPMGFDAFGLPAENYALKTGIHPAIVTKRNIDNIRRQIKRLGFSYDWKREVVTTDPDYYRWTQWIFLQMFDNDLAYQASAPINFCPRCRTGLANEEVKGGLCERCGSEVERRELRQWFLRITRYAERLLDGLDDLDWPESIKTMQREWIGRSTGADVTFRLADPPAGVDPGLVVYTTRPDTLYGATYMVLAPEHSLVGKVMTQERRAEVEAYVERARRKSDRQRTELQKDKTGVFTGAYAVNPMNEEKIPIWIADYVLLSYGTGAIMAVPAHDQRDYVFASRYEIPIVTVIEPHDGSRPPEGRAFVHDGVNVNSGPFDRLSTAKAIPAFTKHLEDSGLGKGVVRYKLRDWLFSRQRYWGEPIPVVHCSGTCGTVAVPESELPLLLPEVERFEPTGTGDSPLAAIEEWVSTACPKCGGPARRETNTMPQWAGSCWYYLRYLDPTNGEKLVDPDLERHWMPVDLYVGGAEHAVLHLMYARFWHMFLNDQGIVSTPEPFGALRNQGMILGFSYRYYMDEADAPTPSSDVTVIKEAAGRAVHRGDGRTMREAWVAAQDVAWQGEGAMRTPVHPTIPGLVLEEVTEKMSKSRGNVVNPDEVIERYGADVMRMYEMFMGPLEASCPWSTEGIEGVHRFIMRSWRLYADRPSNDEEGLTRLRHRTVRSITRHLEALEFNTAISDLMVYVNELTRLDEVSTTDLETLALLMAPYAPHLSEEAWERMGRTQSVHLASWPSFDEKLAAAETVSRGVQINGKLRGEITSGAGAAEDEIWQAAEALSNVARYLVGREVTRVRIVPRLVIFKVK